ncbi:MmgE/PrpD family protein [Nonomuraea monospora]|uniref:MmgE/PrpD family protein n=1 Tax=Nonomuraea monospora TaxID=568818 RepID=A0ABP5PJ81_9ACTN
MTYVRRLAEFAVACRDGELPAAVREDVPGRVLDVLGNCLAAYADPDGDAAPAVLRAVRRWGGSGEATAIGSGDRLPAPSAALVNGTLAHALDFDDTHLPSVLHPSASVIPAALAAAQSMGAFRAAPATPQNTRPSKAPFPGAHPPGAHLSGTYPPGAHPSGAEPIAAGFGPSGGELIAAVAAGVEVCGRLGMASYLPQERNSRFFEQGQHATSICGTLGAAVAAGLLFGLTAEGIADAVGVAASMGAGLIEANRTGGTVKRVHCGWAAHAGVSAAVLAAEGLTGPPTVLEGRFGFFQAWLGGRYDAEALLSGLGERWELLRTVYKPYPTNHFTHPVIDCALALRRGGLGPARIAEIAEIEVGVPAPVLRTIAEPWEEKVRPRSPYHAKFSAPYTVAAALLGGGGLGLALEDFAALEPARLELAGRVRCVADERASEIFPTAFAAVVRVRLRDGSTLEHRVDSSRGGPEHPLSAAELETKFRSNAGRALPEDRVGELAEAVRKLGAGGTADDVLARAVRAS